MRVRKTPYLFLICVFVFMSGCGSKYGDVIEANKKFVSAMEEYLSATGEADSAKEIAKAITIYAANLEKLVPELKQAMHKYPELEDTTKVPEELKDLQDQMGDLEEKTTKSFMNMMKYMMDPEVQAAQQKLQKAMMKMAPEN